MKRKLLGTMTALALAASLPATAAERGAAGLRAVSLSVTNTGEAAIACGAAVAHWFAVDLGRAEAGDTVGIALFVDAATGTQYLLNDNGDRLPVEAIWCGLAGRTWASRAMIGPPRRAGEPAAAVTLSCRADDGRLSCR